MKSIVLDSKYTFIFIIVCGVFYTYALFSELNIIANETLTQKLAFLIYIFFGILIIYAFITSMEIIELNSETITIYTFFKLGSTKKFNMTNVVKIVQKTNPSTNNIRSATLIFSNGKKIEVNEFQRGFTEARIFLRECFADEFFVIKSRWSW